MTLKVLYNNGRLRIRKQKQGHDIQLQLCLCFSHKTPLKNVNLFAPY